jgi:hypothetical protein
MVIGETVCSLCHRETRSLTEAVENVLYMRDSMSLFARNFTRRMLQSAPCRLSACTTIMGAPFARGCINLEMDKPVWAWHSTCIRTNTAKHQACWTCTRQRAKHAVEMRKDRDAVSPTTCLPIPFAPHLRFK